MGVNDINSANLGSTRPLAYGYVRATGTELVHYQNPGNQIQYGFYGLGEGEWDGFDSLWVNGFICATDWSAGDYYGPGNYYGGLWTAPHFHPGTDTPLGITGGYSAGYDQLRDDLWRYIPTVVTRLSYSGLVYIALSWGKEPITAGQKMSVVGDYRATRCRMFDASGTQTSYGFTTNPIWHFVDTWLRIAIVPRTQYSIHMVTGPDPLPADAIGRFDWGSVYEAAQDCDYVLANGRPRFSGSYAFTSRTTLAAIHEQILMCCRGYQQESAGKISVMIDKPRASVFLLEAKHLIPGTFTADEKQVHGNANKYTAAFLDLELPSVATIVSITQVAASPNYIATIVTDGSNPCAANDRICVGGNSATELNQYYLVKTVNGPVITALPNGGTGYTYAGTGTGGSIGYDQSRFSPRSPAIPHKQHALAQGQLASAAAGNKASKQLTVTLDFANMTWGQANRLLKYEIYRDLGFDQSPWKPPIQITLTAWAEAVDGNWDILKKAKCGQVLYLHPSASYEYAGYYEIIERQIHPFQADSTSALLTEMMGEVTGRGSMSRMSDQNAGRITLLLRTYNSSVFFDTSDSQAAGYFTVPGQELYSGPGPVNSTYQIISCTLAAVDAGDCATITWSSVEIQVGGGILLSYVDGSATNEPYGTTLYAFVDDPFLQGGTVPLQFTAHPGALSGSSGRMFIDSVATPVHGGGGTGGGGGGGLPHCFVKGSPIHTEDGVMPNFLWFERWSRGENLRLRGRQGLEEVESAKWVLVDRFVIIDLPWLKPIGCSETTEFLEESGGRYVAVSSLVQGVSSIDTVDGFCVVQYLEAVEAPSMVLSIKLKGPSHEYLAGAGYWSHNKDFGL